MREKLETLSVSVLRDFAKDKKIKNISAMRKSELIDAIIAAEENESTVGYTDNEATVNTVLNGQLIILKQLILIMK